MDDSIGLASQSRQAIDSSIRPDIENYFGIFRCVLPTFKDVVFQEVSTKKVILALKHFIQVAGHLESGIFQFRNPLFAATTGCGTPEGVYSSKFSSSERKTPSIEEQQLFEC